MEYFAQRGLPGVEYKYKETRLFELKTEAKVDVPDRWSYERLMRSSEVKACIIRPTALLYLQTEQNK